MVLYPKDSHLFATSFLVRLKVLELSLYIRYHAGIQQTPYTPKLVNVKPLGSDSELCGMCSCSIGLLNDGIVFIVHVGEADTSYSCMLNLQM